MFNWTEEFQKLGNREGLISRFIFHVGLSTEIIVENTGLCFPTVRKYIKKFLAEDLISKGAVPGFYRITEKMKKLYPQFCPK